MSTKQVPTRQGTKRSPAAAKPRPLKIFDLRRSLGLSRKIFARLTGFSERAIAGWEAGRPLSDSSRQRMTEIHRLQQRLARVMKARFIPEWLETPNDAFDGLKPVEVVERGQIDQLWRMIFVLESGHPG